MKTDTKAKIIRLAANEQGISPNQLIETLNISAVAIHKHLKELINANLIEKIGQAPRVFYKAKKATQENVTLLPENLTTVLNNSFFYFTPTGKQLSGTEGFMYFLNQTNQAQSPVERAKEYIKILNECNSYKNKAGLIDGTEKILNTFQECFVNKVYYSDFYSLPKYGKTKLGHLLLHGKSGQNKRIIKEIAEITKPDILNIIKMHQIDAIAFAPHSIPRKIEFLKEYKKNLKINLPEIVLMKVFSGDVPIAQKSLSKLSERISNARETIYLKQNSNPFKKILIIDDALGSGSTVNEIARKLHQKGRKIFGYVIVGSYKGFEVIKEV